MEPPTITSIKEFANPLDILHQFGVINMVQQGQINFVGQQQVVDFVFDFQQLRQRERVAHQTQIDIRA